MITAKLIEDYIREHPGTTLSDMMVEFGTQLWRHIKRLEDEKRIYRLTDLRNRKIKHYYLEKNGVDTNGVLDPEI